MLLCLFVGCALFIRLRLVSFFLFFVCVCASQRTDTMRMSPANLQKNTSRYHGLHKIHKKDGIENTILKASFLQPPQYSKRVSLCAINNNSEPPGCWINRRFRIGLTWRSSWSCCIDPSLQDVVVVGSLLWRQLERDRQERERGERLLAGKTRQRKKQTGQGDEHTHTCTQELIHTSPR